MRSFAGRWFADPVVWAGALFGGGATAYAVFAGRYLPYIDWAAHLGLISVLADGGSTGALDFFTRSFAPSPYLLFYLAAAAIGQVVPVDVAAKVVLCLTAGGLALGAASLAEATGRDPRLGTVAPLGMFGLSMGWGFGSFLVATPLFLFALASAERTLHAAERAGAVRGALLARDTLYLAVWLTLLFNAHGFLFFAAVSIIGTRALLFAAARRRTAAPLPALTAVVAAGVPAVLCALPSVVLLLRTPSMEQGHHRPAKLVDFYPLSRHLEGLYGDLLDRGSVDHYPVMQGAAVLLAVWLAWSLARAHRAERRTWGMEVYAGLLAALYLFGPMTVEWPSSIWMIYPRFGVIAAIALFLLPRASLRGPIGTALALAPLLLVAANARVNANHVRDVSAAAQPYERVREVIPRGARVFQLTAVGPGDPPLHYHALGSLFGYLMVDGASFVPFLFDKGELPVHLRRDRPPPPAPHWTAPFAFDPRTHGAHYDFLVLRGRQVVERAKNAGLHELVEESGGWFVFRTKAPARSEP